MTAKPTRAELEKAWRQELAIAIGEGMRGPVSPEQQRRVRETADALHAHDAKEPK